MYAMDTTRLECPPDDYLVVIPGGIIEDAGRYDTRYLSKPMGIIDLTERLGITDRTLCVYRAIAWENCQAYTESVQTRNPDWIDDVCSYYEQTELLNQASQRVPPQVRDRFLELGRKKIKKVFPDRPFFPVLESKILIAIANLFHNHRRMGVRLTKNNKRQAVIEYITANPNFWSEEQC